MDRNSDVFSEEYAIEAGTSTSTDLIEEAPKEEVEVEEEKYGLSKPTRTIIRARITSHESETR